jgi:transcriptional regulator with XRE-family HTH domain
MHWLISFYNSLHLGELAAMIGCLLLTIGQWIQELRYRKGFTQAKLAELVGVDTRTVQRWEADEQTPRARMMFQLQQYDPEFVLKLEQSNGKERLVFVGNPGGGKSNITRERLQGYYND